MKLIGYSWGGCDDAECVLGVEITGKASLSRVNACCRFALSCRSKELLSEFL